MKGIVNVRKVLKGKIARLRAAHQSVKMEEPVWEDHALAKLISVVNIAKRSCHLAPVRMGMILMGNLMGMLKSEIGGYTPMYDASFFWIF